MQLKKHLEPLTLQKQSLQLQTICKLNKKEQARVRIKQFSGSFKSFIVFYGFCKCGKDSNLCCYHNAAHYDLVALLVNFAYHNLNSMCL